MILRNLKSFVLGSSLLTPISRVLVLVVVVFLLIDLSVVSSWASVIVAVVVLYTQIRDKKIFLLISILLTIFLLNIINPMNYAVSEKLIICGLVKDIENNRIETSFTKIEGKTSTRPIFVKLNAEQANRIKKYNYICLETQSSFRKYQRFAVLFDLTQEEPPISIEGVEFANYINDFSNYINQSLDKYFSADSGLIKALIFGIKEDLLAEDKKSFQNIGASHLLVASGANIIIIISIIQVISRTVRKFTGSVYFGFLVEVSVIGVYLLIVGLEGSLVRAFVFWIFLNIERLVGRRQPFLIKLLYCIGIITILFPENLFSLSFYLSIAALIGINIGDELVECLKLKESNMIVKLLFINLMITVSTGIITSYFFAQLNFTGIISNLIMLPLAEFIVGIGFIFSVVTLTLGILDLEFLNNILTFVSSILSLLIEILRSVVDFIEEIGLPDFLNSKFYINLNTLITLIALLLLFWFYLKFINFNRIRERTRNI